MGFVSVGRIEKLENIHKAYPLKIHNFDAKINTLLCLSQQTHSGLIQAAYGTVGQVIANEPNLKDQIYRFATTVPSQEEGCWFKPQLGSFFDFACFTCRLVGHLQVHSPKTCMLG